jgi:hypothetical protein
MVRNRLIAIQAFKRRNAAAMFLPPLAMIPNNSATLRSSTFADSVGFTA